LFYSNNCSNPSPRHYGRENQGEIMSTAIINTRKISAGYVSRESIINQGFSRALANPSDTQSLRLSRRGRLARTGVVLSLTVVMAAGFAAQSGAQAGPGSHQSVASTAPSFETVVVAPGETLWTVAVAYSTGDVQGLISEIREVNHLKGFDLQAGQKLRVPVSSR
jgi:hypothetical protein